MQFTSVNIVHNEATKEVDYYIVSYSARTDKASMDGQIQVPGDKADLSNVLDVAREYMIELVKS